MTRVTVWVDGYPYIVSSAGALDIGRMFDGETVAVRGDSPVTVEFDEEAIERERPVFRWMYRLIDRKGGIPYF